MAVTFDTLKFARRLRAANVPEPQAEAMAEAFAEATGQELVTKADLQLEGAAYRRELAATRAELRAEIADLRSELKAEIADLRLELRTGLAAGQAATEAVRTDLGSQLAGLRSDIDKLGLRLTFRLGAVIVASISIAGVVLRFV